MSGNLVEGVGTTHQKNVVVPSSYTGLLLLSASQSYAGFSTNALACREMGGSAVQDQQDERIED